MKLRLPASASIETKHFIFHPLNFGIATLMRVGVVFHGRKLMVHHFLPHQEDEFHDHPWSFRTLILWGSYRDESPCPECHGTGVIFGTGDRSGYDGAGYYHAPDEDCWKCGGLGLIVEILRRGDRRYRPAQHAHRTSCDRHTWTIVFTSRKQRTWCKGTPERWICGGKVEDFDATRGMVKVEDR